MSHLSQESINFILTALAGVSPDSWSYLFAKNASTHGIGQVPIRRSEMEKFLQSVELKSRSNYYISANGYMGNQHRSKDRLYSLNNIVVDIDCHGRERVPGLLDLRLDRLVHKILNDGVDEYGLLAPSAITYTGRGVQVWWFHESLSAYSNRWTWEAVGKRLCTIINQILKDNISSDMMESLAGLKLDDCASAALSGVYRIPGTMNQAANCVATATILSTYRYTLQDLKAFNNGIILPKENHFNGYKPGDCTEWAKRMVGMIEHFRNYRDNEIGDETRNNFCLAYYCMMVSAGFDPERIEADLADFNEGFKRPMNRHELERTLITARKKHYKFSCKSLMKLLCMTVDEAEYLKETYKFNGLMGKKPKKSNKKTRDDRVMKLYRTGKYTMKQIGEKVGITEPTVRSILHKHGIQSREEKCKSRHNEILYLRKVRHMAVREIANSVQCSLRTVWRVLQEAGIPAQDPEENMVEQAAEKAAIFCCDPCHEQKVLDNNGYLYASGDEKSPVQPAADAPHFPDRAALCERRPLGRAVFSEYEPRAPVRVAQSLPRSTRSVFPRLEGSIGAGISSQSSDHSHCSSSTQSVALSRCLHWIATYAEQASGAS